MTSATPVLYHCFPWYRSAVINNYYCLRLLTLSNIMGSVMDLMLLCLRFFQYPFACW